MFPWLKPRVALAIYVLAIVFVSVVPSVGVSVNNADKYGHYVAYLGLGVLVCLVLDHTGPRVSGLIGGVVLGAVLELVQSQVPGREMSLADGIVNALGVLSGLLVFALFGRRLRALVAMVFGWRELEHG